MSDRVCGWLLLNANPADSVPASSSQRQRAISHSAKIDNEPASTGSRNANHDDGLSSTASIRKGPDGQVMTTGIHDSRATLAGTTGRCAVFSSSTSDSPDSPRYPATSNT